MAKQVVGATVEVEFQSVGNLRKAIKEANSELLKTQAAFGATSKEAIEAAKRVAGLRDALQDANETAQLFDPGQKFKAVGNAVSALANGFTAVQGALGLLGVESKEVEKQLLKVQSALALSQGLSGLLDSGKDFARLASVIKGQVVTAFTTLKGAIAATGIGLLVVALGTIVQYWDDIKGLVNGVSSEQEKINKSTKDNLKTQEDKLSAIDGQSNQLKLQGKSEREILMLKIKQTDEAIKAAEVNLQNAKATKDAQVAAAKRNQEFLQGALKFISVPLTALLRGIDQIGAAFGKNFNLEEKITKSIATFFFDPEEVAKEGDAAIKEAEDILNKLKEQRAGFQLSVQSIDKAAADKRKEKQEEEKKERERIAKEIAEQKANDLQALIEAENKEFETLQNIKTEQDKIEKERQDEIQKEKDAADERERKRLLDKFELQKQYNNAVIAAEQDLQNAKFQAVSAGLDLLASLAGKNKAISNALFAVDKGLAIAKVVIDTQKEIAGYYANPTWKLLPDGGIALATAQSVKAKIRAGISIASIAATSIQKFMGGGAGAAGGGGIPQLNTSAPLQANLSPSVQAQALNSQAINNLAVTPTRAYILDRDIQNQNQINSFINRNASI